MRCRWAGIVIIAILQLVLFKAPVFAATNPVKVKADRVEYEDHSRQIEASGNVEISYKDIKITAERALLDQDLKMVVATGKVRVEQGEDSLQGEKFIYDIRSEQGWVTPVFTEVTDPEIKGSAYFTATEGLVRGDDTFLKDSSFTSCDLTHPHYHLSAEQVEYYPEDRIVFHKMWYWEGKVPLLYFPYFVLSLKEDDSLFDLKAGHESDAGWYLYVGYNYYLNAKNKGTIYTKITEWGGDGIGFKNTTRSSATSKWYQDFFYKDNSDNYKIYDEYKLALGYENWTNSKLRWKGDLENWYRDDLKGSGYSDLNLSLTGHSPYPSLRMNYQNDQDLSETYSFGESWSYETASKINIRTNGAWYYKSESDGDLTDNFSYNLDFSKDWGWSNVSIKISNNQTYNTSETEKTSDTNYLPDITFNIPKWKLPWIGEVTYHGQYTNYEYVAMTNNEITSEQAGERFANNLSKAVNLWKKEDLTIYADSKLRHRYYVVDHSGFDYVGLIQGINLQKKFSGALSTTLGINYTFTNGEIPSMFVLAYGDYLTDGGALINRWTWRGATIGINLNTGYNFTYKTFNPVDISATWNPGTKGSASFSTIFYVQDDQYYHSGLGITNFNLRYLPKENWQINLGVNYNFQDDSWGERYFETLITQQLTQNWRVRLSTRYSDVVGDFSVLNFDLAYDWHCREVIFSYDYIEGIYNVQLNFKAFPQASLSTNMDPTGLLYQ